MTVTHKTVTGHDSLTIPRSIAAVNAVLSLLRHQVDMQGVYHGLDTAARTIDTCNQKLPGSLMLT